MKPADKQIKGSINVSDQAIAAIVSAAIQEMKEVVALMRGRNKLTDRNKFHKAIGIKIKEFDLSIDLHPIVLLGTPLHQLSRMLQTKVKQEVERITGLSVSAVNVEIVGIIAGV